MGLIDAVDTLILGANTYAQAKGYWPTPLGRLSCRDRDARPCRHHPGAQGAER